MSPLTDREHQIMADVMAGMTSRESGANRGSSPNTVRTQRQTILRKLRAKNIAEAVAVYLVSAPLSPGHPLWRDEPPDKWQGTAR